MWLLNTQTLQLHEFSGKLPGWTRRSERQIPHYAILSHCWREEEVLFQDIQDLGRARGMAGFPKIERCCEQALKIGYKWAWIDTCCIDKSSSAELSEAINSMFKWYGHASTCLVYLDDVDHGNPHHKDSLFRKSRWFTRGWTLQELIAPKRLIFFSKSWSFLGTKGSLMTLLSTITKIPVDALSHKSSFRSFSIAQRMSWASKRQTTRVEDQAYSLMGLFDIFMPILYGEGSSAFRRLQLEIIGRSSDQTIFAWSLENSGSTPCHFSSLTPSFQVDGDESFSVLELPYYFCILYSSILARSPADFQGSGRIVPLPVSARYRSQGESPESTMEYSWTHLGLRIRMPLIRVHIRTKKQQLSLGMLSCWDPEEQSIYGITLFRKDTQDPYRCYNLGSFGSGMSDSTSHLVSITKKDYDEVVPKLAVPQNVYITNEPDLGDDSDSDSAIGHDFPMTLSHSLTRVRLLIVLPDVSLRKAEELGFSLVRLASRQGTEPQEDMEVWNNPGNDVLLEFKLLPDTGTDTLRKYPDCPSSHAHLLFHSHLTGQAFSVFIGYSRHGLLGAFHPRISIDVAYHRLEEFSVLKAHVICVNYDHHDHHGHFQVPSHVRFYREDLEDTWKAFKCDDAVDHSGLVRYCKCECSRYREATATKIYGDYKRGLSVTTTVWKEHDVEGNTAYCTAWVELSLFGRIYGSREGCDELDARSDIADWGSICSDEDGSSFDNISHRHRVADYDSTTP